MIHTLRTIQRQLTFIFCSRAFGLLIRFSIRSARSDISLNEPFPCLRSATYTKMTSNTYPTKPSKTGSSYGPRSSSSKTSHLQAPLQPARRRTNESFLEAYTSNPSQSIYANSATSSRSNRGYGSKPTSVVIHNGGGQTCDTTTSTSASNSGYYN